MELSQNANIVMKNQCRLLQKQLKSQAEQSDAITEAQKKEISRLLDNNINHGVKLLHKEFRSKMAVLKTAQQEQLDSHMNEHKQEMNKLKDDQQKLKQEQ